VVVNIVAHAVFFHKLRILMLFGWMVQLRGGQDAAMVWYLTPIPKQTTGAAAAD